MTTQSGERESLAYVPDYVDQRHAYAGDAGLTLEKQTRKQGLLSSWYSGSEAQFRSTRLLRIPRGFNFPSRVGGRKVCSLPVFCPAAPGAELKCTIAKTADDRYRLTIANEIMPVSWRLLGPKIEVYKYCDLREGANTGPATVYIGPLAALQAAGIAPPEAEHQIQRNTREKRVCLWQSQALVSGRHRFVVHHEAEAKASAQDEERGRSNFKNAEQYQDWLLEVVAASIGMIRRQLRAKTKRRYIYTVPGRTLKELEAHFARIRKTLARAEILVQKEDVRDEERRAALRQAALAAMRDADFQRFLGIAVAPPPKKR